MNKKYKDEASAVAKKCEGIVQRPCYGCEDRDCSTCAVKALIDAVESFVGLGNTLTVTRKTAIRLNGGCSITCGWWDSFKCVPGFSVKKDFGVDMAPGPGCPRYKDGSPEGNVKSESVKANE